MSYRRWAKTLKSRRCGWEALCAPLATRDRARPRPGGRVPSVVVERDRRIAGPKSTRSRSRFDNAYADHQYDADPIQPNGHWNGHGGQGVDCMAVWSMSKPVVLPAGTTLTFEMECQASATNGENLGHFRLSVSTDPAALARDRIRSEAEQLTDPWHKLAAAYQLRGDQQAIDRVVERHPKLAGPIGDLFTRKPTADWHCSRNLQQGHHAPDHRRRPALQTGSRLRGPERLRGCRRSRLVAGPRPGTRMGLNCWPSSHGASLPVATFPWRWHNSRSLNRFTNKCWRPIRKASRWQPRPAQLLLAELENEGPGRWTVLKPTR